MQQLLDTLTAAIAARTTAEQALAAAQADLATKQQALTAALAGAPTAAQQQAITTAQAEVTAAEQAVDDAEEALADAEDDVTAAQQALAAQQQTQPNDANNGGGLGGTLSALGIAAGVVVAAATFAVFLAVCIGSVGAGVMNLPGTFSGGPAVAQSAPAPAASPVALTGYGEEANVECFSGGCGLWVPHGQSGEVYWETSGTELQPRRRNADGTLSDVLTLNDGTVVERRCFPADLSPTTATSSCPAATAVVGNERI